MHEKAVHLVMNDTYQIDRIPPFTLYTSLLTLRFVVPCANWITKFTSNLRATNPYPTN